MKSTHTVSGHGTNAATQSVMELKKVWLCLFAITCFNLIFYIFPELLGLSKYLNVVCFLVTTLVLKDKVIFLLPVYIFFPIQVHTGIPFFSMSVLCSLVLCFGIKRERKFVISRWILAYITLLAYVVISYIIFNHMQGDIKYLVNYVEALVVFFSITFVLNSEAKQQLFLKIFAYTSAFSFLFKVLFLLQKEKVLTISGVDANQYSGKLDIYAGGEIVDRLLLIGQEPNYSATLNLVGLAASIALFNSVSNYKQSIIVWGCVFFNMAQIFGSFSRSAMVSSSFLFLWLLLNRKVSAVIKFVGVMAVTFFVASSDSIGSRVASITKSSSADDRVDLWEKALEMWSDNVIFGRGFTEYIQVYNDASHNTFLQILAELGIIGLVLYLVSFLTCSRLLTAVSGTKNSKGLVFVSLLALFVMLNTITFFDVGVLLLLMTVISFLGVRNPNSYRRLN